MHDNCETHDMNMFKDACLISRRNTLRTSASENKSKNQT